MRGLFPKRSGLPVVAPDRMGRTPEWNAPLARQYGMPLPLVYGTARVPGKLLWLGPVSDAQDVQIRDTSTSPTAWKLGPGKVAPAIVGLCEGPITRVLRCWRWGDCFAWIRWLSRPVDSGAAITELLGDGTEPVWSVQASLTIKDESHDVPPNVTSYEVPTPGSIIANLGATRQVADEHGAPRWIEMALVTSTPAAGEYRYAAGVYTFNAYDALRAKTVRVRRDLTLVDAWTYPMLYRGTAQIRFEALAVSEGELPD
jgi:hypothetical protein